MSLFRVCTILRSANLLAVLLWLYLLRSGGLLISAELPLAVLSAVVWLSAVAAFLVPEPPRPAQAALFGLDLLAVAFAAMHAQAAGPELLPGLLVPLCLAALTLPLAATTLLWALAAGACAWLLRRGGAPWSDPRVLVRASALALPPLACAVAGALLLSRRALVVRSALALQRQFQLTEYVTHLFFQLRDYMTSISTATEQLALAAQDQASKDLARKLGRMVAEASAKIVRTVDAVQTTTRRTLPTSAEFDLSETLREAFEASRASHPRPRVRAKLVCEPLIIQGNRRALFCVFASVLDNAFEAFESGAAGTVSATLSSSGPLAELTVVDDAGGFSPDRLARAFEPLSTSKSEQGGLGLGLAMARRMLDASGGSLELQSAQGVTTIRIQVPLQPTLPVIRTGDSTWASRRAAAGGGAPR